MIFVRNDFLLFFPLTLVQLRNVKSAKNVLCEVPADAREVNVRVFDHSHITALHAVLEENPHLVREEGIDALLGITMLNVVVKD